MSPPSSSSSSEWSNSDTKDEKLHGHEKARKKRSKKRKRKSKKSSDKAGKRSDRKRHVTSRRKKSSKSTRRSKVLVYSAVIEKYTESGSSSSSWSSSSENEGQCVVDSQQRGKCHTSSESQTIEMTKTLDLDVASKRPSGLNASCDLQSMTTIVTNTNGALHNINSHMQEKDTAERSKPFANKAFQTVEEDGQSLKNNACFRQRVLGLKREDDGDSSGELKGTEESPEKCIGVTNAEQRIPLISMAKTVVDSKTLLPQSNLNDHTEHERGGHLCRKYTKDKVRSRSRSRSRSKSSDRSRSKRESKKSAASKRRYRRGSSSSSSSSDRYRSRSRSKSKPERNSRYHRHIETTKERSHTKKTQAKLSSRSTLRRHLRSSSRSSSRSGSHSRTRHKTRGRSRSRSHKRTRSRSRQRGYRRSRRMSRSTSRRRGRSRSRRKTESISPRRQRSRSPGKGHSRIRSRSRSKNRSSNKSWSDCKSIQQLPSSSSDRKPSTIDNDRTGDELNQMNTEKQNSTKTTSSETEVERLDTIDKDVLRKPVKDLSISKKIEIKISTPQSMIATGSSTGQGQSSKVSLFGEWKPVKQAPNRTAGLAAWTDFCKMISKTENDESWNGDEKKDEDTPIAVPETEEKVTDQSSGIQHPFVVKPQPLPSSVMPAFPSVIVTPAQAIAAGIIIPTYAPSFSGSGNLQSSFPVSSGQNHRHHEDNPGSAEDSKKVVAAEGSFTNFPSSLGSGFPDYTEMRKSIFKIGGQPQKISKDFMHSLTPVRGGIGEKLLQKMGWEQGQPLGKRKEGFINPLEFDVKFDRKGLCASDEAQQLELTTKKSAAVASPCVGPGGKHPVSSLMELCTKRKWPPPEFQLIFDQGPSHRKTFLFKVCVDSVWYQSSSTSRTKKEAKAQAALAALKGLGFES